jgi:hypothetical protein
VHACVLRVVLAPENRHNRHKRDVRSAEKFFRVLVEKSPRHAAGVHQLARVLLEVSKGASEVSGKKQVCPEEALQMFEKVMSRMKEVRARPGWWSALRHTRQSYHAENHYDPPAFVCLSPFIKSS